MSTWAASRRQEALEKGFSDPNDNKTNPKAMEKSHVKYWRESNGPGHFTINARGLSIDNSDRSVYWKWTTDREIEIAEVAKAKWLGVKGSFKTVNLSYGVTYKVSFLLKMTPESTMKGKKVSVKLSLPGINQENQVPLPSSPNEWLELEVGQFELTAQNIGDMNFAMEQLFENWERGLIIKWVQIKPHKSPSWQLYIPTIRAIDVQLPSWK